MIQMPRLVSLLLIATLVVVLGATFFQVVAPFLMPLFLAAVFAILSQPIYKRFLQWTKGRITLSAALSTVAVLLIVLVPLVFGTVMSAVQLKKDAEDILHQDPDAKGDEKLNWRIVLTAIRTNTTVQSLVKRYGDLTGQPVDLDEMEREVDDRLREATTALARKTLGSTGLSLLGAAVGFLIGALTFVLALFYFLADGPALVEGAINLIPVHRDYQRALITQFDQAMRGVVTATFAAALGQGIATGIGMTVAGFDHFFIVTLLATFTALIPLLGTWLVWAPYVVYLWSDGHQMAASLLALYSIVFVGLLDNVIRTYVLQSNVKLHPLLAFVSVLGGIQALGLWGVFIGPIVASCFYALLKIFNTELTSLARARGSGAAVDTEVSTVVMSGADLKRPAPSPSAPTGSTPATTPRPALIDGHAATVDPDASTLVMNINDLKRPAVASSNGPVQTSASATRPVPAAGPAGAEQSASAGNKPKGPQKS